MIGQEWWLSVMYHIDNYDGGSFGTEQNLENKRPDNHQLH